MLRMSRHYKFVITSLFASIIFILAFTPFGFIQLGVIKATIIHIPVILGSILLGPTAGAALGFLFGLTSFISNTTSPALLSFAFSPLIPVPGTGGGSILALVICFVPRILVGVVPYYVYRFLHRFSPKQAKWESVPLFVAGVVGSMTNTILVMNLIYVIFQHAYATVKNIPADAIYDAIVAIMVVNGIPEALVAGIMIVALGKTLIKLNRNRSQP